MNSVIIIGNLTRDVNLHDGNTPFCNLNVAVNDRVKNRDSGDWEERPSFISVKVFGRQAENCANFLSKGKKVAVKGKLQTGSYEKQDGTKVYTTDVIAQEVEFLTRRSDADENNPSEDDVPEGFHEISESDDVPF